MTPMPCDTQGRWRATLAPRQRRYAPKAPQPPGSERVADARERQGTMPVTWASHMGLARRIEGEAA